MTKKHKNLNTFEAISREVIREKSRAERILKRIRSI
jgi:hypothetical protein